MAIDRDLKTQILIWYYQNQPPNISEIARKAGVDPKTVRRVVAHWETFKTTMHRKSTGAKPKLEPVDLASFYAFAETIQGRTSTLKQFQTRFRLPFTLSRISQMLIKRGLRCRIQIKKPLLEPRHIVARLKFGKDNEMRDWTTVVFSDEKTVQNYFNGKKLVRRRAGEELSSDDQFLSVANRKIKVNLWGFLAAKSWGLFLLPNKADGEDYIKMLQTAFLPTIKETMTEFIFMQDGASIHSPAKEFLKENEIPLLDWPAKSPDLNPIENVWGLMQKVVNKWFLKKGIPKTRPQLFSLCKAAFNVVCRKHCQAMFDSVPKRIRSVIENEGKMTKY